MEIDAGRASLQPRPSTVLHVGKTDYIHGSLMLNHRHHEFETAVNRCSFQLLRAPKTTCVRYGATVKARR